MWIVIYKNISIEIEKIANSILYAIKLMQVEQKNSKQKILNECTITEILFLHIFCKMLGPFTWKSFLRNTKRDIYIILKLRVECS